MRFEGRLLRLSIPLLMPTSSYLVMVYWHSTHPENVQKDVWAILRSLVSAGVDCSIQFVCLALFLAVLAPSFSSVD